MTDETKPSPTSRAASTGQCIRWWSAAGPSGSRATSFFKMTFLLWFWSGEVRQINGTRRWLGRSDGHGDCWYVALARPPRIGQNHVRSLRRSAAVSQPFRHLIDLFPPPTGSAGLSGDMGMANAARS